MQIDTSNLHVAGNSNSAYEKILTPGATLFLKSLHQRFNSTRKELLEQRKVKQNEIDSGVYPTFLTETEHIRNSDWTIAPLPEDLQDRRVEITGPVDRKMIINALNSGAKVFMADLEDSNSPTWENTIEGQINLKDAVNRTISLDGANGKKYELNDEIATLIVRPRGWHLEEKHILVDSEPLSASLVDFGLYFYHNAKTLIENGSGPYFYLPKMESHHEARLWNDVFIYAQEQLGIPRGSIKATVLLETIVAAFEMDEILYELRDHSAGINCGRWDYIFSYIKKFRHQPHVILPDRSLVTMTVPFMRSYSLLTIKTCHKRNAPAIGGMAAQIPVKNDPKANDIAFEKVRADKEREANDGHDGTWVAHPGLVPVAMEVFNRVMPQANQIDRKREDVVVTADDLVAVPDGEISEEGLRTNISVGIQYIASWLRGKGAAPINHLMEDAATAEISRAQVWQWIRHPKGVLNDGRKVTFEMVEELKVEEMQKVKQQMSEDSFNKGRFSEAIQLFDELIKGDDFPEFLTIRGYDVL